MTAVVLPRRRILLACAASSTGGLASILAHAQAPAVITSERSRPRFPPGVQIGDVLADRGDRLEPQRPARPPAGGVATSAKLRQRATRCAARMRSR